MLFLKAVLAGMNWLVCTVIFLVSHKALSNAMEYFLVMGPTMSPWRPSLASLLGLGITTNFVALVLAGIIPLQISFRVHTWIFPDPDEKT